MKTVKILLCLFFLFSITTAQNFAARTPQLKLSQQSPERESGFGNFKAKYVLLSLVLPGAGEWFTGNKKMAKIFFASEFMLWAGYWGARSYTNVLENNYTTYAAVHAGVNTASKDDQYWIDIGNAADIYEFNAEKRVGRDLDATYEENAENYWQWDSEESRFQYVRYRFKEHDWKRRLNIVLGGLILNRIVSAIDVIRLIRTDGKNDNKQHSRLYFDYFNNRQHGEVYRLNMNINW